jgi:malonyl CoA-acyl carrier protein transacylase
MVKEMARSGDIAMLFPGQGSQTADMRDLVERHRPDLLELAQREQRVRAKRLPVAGAFHSPLVEPAVEPFRRLAEHVEVRAPRVRDLGATRYEETGPGRVLTNLVRKSLEDVEAEAPVAMEAAGA